LTLTGSLSLKSAGLYSKHRITSQPLSSSWNNLPNHVVSAGTINTLKDRCVNWLHFVIQI